MPNQDLKDKYFTCTDEVINSVNSALNRYQNGGSTKGFKRAKDIVEDKKISYSQMKRLKNYFDSYEGEGKDDEYILNGGDVMKQWVESTLGNAREVIHSVKKTEMNAGKENAFKKTHTKDNDNSNPTNVNLPKIHKGSTRDNVMNGRTVYESLDEEIKGTRYLIEYMNNKNDKII